MNSQEALTLLNECRKQAGINYKLHAQCDEAFEMVKMALLGISIPPPNSTPDVPKNPEELPSNSDTPASQE